MQNDQNPDVNTPHPYDSNGEADSPGSGRDDSGRTAVERPDPTMPVPPDVEPAAPVEEPPESEGVPVGDVDDSPKRIA
jgi:hypothetical protein